MPVTRARSYDTLDSEHSDRSTENATYTSTTNSGGGGNGNSAGQSSIPGISIAQIRSVLGEQRKLLQETGYVSMVDEVVPGMTRLDFAFRYMRGVAVKRHAKHRRASARLQEATCDL